MSEREDAAPNLAIFCDFENVAIGVREAKFDDFDIEMVLERLLDKGKIVVKKAYADWDRYKNAKRAMHEAAFELIEIKGGHIRDASMVSMKGPAFLLLQICAMSRSRAISLPSHARWGTSHTGRPAPRCGRR